MSQTIDGHKVDGDEDGRHYLYALETSEAKIIFEHAKKHGTADFEDHKYNRNYTLRYDKNTLVYAIEKRKAKSTGWWWAVLKIWEFKFDSSKEEMFMK